MGVRYHFERVEEVNPDAEDATPPASTQEIQKWRLVDQDHFEETEFNKALGFAHAPTSSQLGDRGPATTTGQGTGIA